MAVNHNLPLNTGINLGIDFVISGETRKIELHKILCRNAFDLGERNKQSYVS